MTAVFEGRCYRVIDSTPTGVWLGLLTNQTSWIYVAITNPDLVLDPTDEDLMLAAAYARGEISAFEYPDGHTYPAGREIRRLKPHRALMAARRQGH